MYHLSYDNLAYLKDMNNIVSDIKKLQLLSKRSILVTGANGLIGSYVVDALLWANQKYNYEIKVYALCRNLKRAQARFSHHSGNTQLNFIIQDISQPLDTDEQFDFIVHAACNAHPAAYAENPVGIMQSNFIGTYNILEYVLKQGKARFLFISSSEIYGEDDQIDAFAENDFGILDFTVSRSCYSESKRAAETLCASFRQQYNLDTMCLRPGFIYGAAVPEDNSRSDAQFFRKVIEKQDIILKSSGMQYRSYGYVADVANAIITLLLDGVGGEAYNVASKQSNSTIRDFAQSIADSAGVGIQFEHASDWEKKGYSSFEKAILNTDKISGIGWESKYTLKEGVAQTLNILQY